ncbi:DUF2073 domain-containing protein [Nanohaloarchaea archaeon]|jgi:hypothetical protein|nr:DUF2073 domain-containing protein [Nanohaloarchaea archaeon H12]MBY6293894.1 DUF2073 domain-containing protein [Nanohaloarchaea archaeon H01]NMI76828.1 DUF2073 domain-containing protein [Candidatus Nanohaloarchaea archaeon]NMJ77075.1 DUF2073 domain-containing protein [Candidatus Nanohaloarchaea archaeon]
MGEETVSGVTIEFLSKKKLQEESFDEKVDSIITRVKENAVVVLEEGWSPEEERYLIEHAMEEVDEEFPGIEFLGLNERDSKIHRAKRMFYEKVLNEKYRQGITIVGNSRVMERVKKERDAVSFLAKLEEEE